MPDHIKTTVKSSHSHHHSESTNNSNQIDDSIKTSSNITSTQQQQQQIASTSTPAFAPPPTPPTSSVALTRVCESCAVTHAGTYGSGRFCSAACAKKVGARTKWATRAASVIPAARRAPPPPRHLLEGSCEACHKVHDMSYGSGRFCSVHCARRVAATKKWQKTRTDKCKRLDAIKPAMLAPPPQPLPKLSETDIINNKKVSLSQRIESNKGQIGSSDCGLQLPSPVVDGKRRRIQDHLHIASFPFSQRLDIASTNSSSSNPSSPATVITATHSSKQQSQQQPSSPSSSTLSPSASPSPLLPPSQQQTTHVALSTPSPHPGQLSPMLHHPHHSPHPHPNHPLAHLHHQHALPLAHPHPHHHHHHAYLTAAAPSSMPIYATTAQQHHHHHPTYAQMYAPLTTAAVAASSMYPAAYHPPSSFVANNNDNNSNNANTSYAVHPSGSGACVPPLEVHHHHHLHHQQHQNQQPCEMVVENMSMYVTGSGRQTQADYKKVAAPAYDMEGVTGVTVTRTSIQIEGSTHSENASRSRGKSNINALIESGVPADDDVEDEDDDMNDNFDDDESDNDHKKNMMKGETKKAKRSGEKAIKNRNGKNTTLKVRGKGKDRVTDMEIENDEEKKDRANYVDRNKEERPIIENSESAARALLWLRSSNS